MKKCLWLIMIIALLLSSSVVYGQGRGAECLGAGYLAPRLAGGMWARVTAGGTNNRVRSDPSLGATQVGSIPPTTPVYVTSAPACADGMLFWQVGFRDIGTANSDIDDFGWTAEGKGTDYWLEPMFQTWNVATNRQQINAGNLFNLKNLGQAQYGMISRLAWSGDSAKLAVNTVGAVWIHDVKSPNASPIMLRPNLAETNTTTAIAFMPSNTVITAGDAVRIWDIFSGSQVSSPTVNLGTVDQYGNKAINPSGTLMAAANTDGSISLINLQTGQPTALLTGHTLVGGLTFSPNGARLASGGGSGMVNSDNTIRVWDANTGVQLSMIDVGAPSYKLAFSPNSNLLAVPYFYPDGAGGALAGLQVSDMTTFTTVTLQHPDYSFSADAFAFSADGSIVAAGAAAYNPSTTLTTGVVLYFNASSGAQLGSVTVSGTPGQISFSPDGTLMAVSTADPYFWGPDTVSVWGITQ